MTIPIKNEYPIYAITLPISKKNVKFRPFLKKEEKLLLMALESKNESEMLATMKQIIMNCCLVSFDVEEMSILDIEYFFLNLRARSISEVIDARYRCDNVTGEKDGELIHCDNDMKIQLNITELQIGNENNIDLKVELSSTMGLQMKYPKMDTVRQISESRKNNADVDHEMSVVVSCIEFIYDVEDIHYLKDYSEADSIEFLESLTKKQFEKIEEFFLKLPYIYKEVLHKCNKCNFDHVIKVEGYQNFFV